MRDLYICLTHYHLMVSIIKAKNKGNCSDIIICCNLIKDEIFVDRLKRTNVFENVIKYDYPYTRLSFIDKIFQKRIVVQQVEKSLDLNFSKYDKIFIFNEMHYLAWYLQAKRLTYVLCEDGTNYYKDVHIDKKNISFKRKILALFGVGFKYFGTYKNIEYIEVNDKNLVNIKKHNVIELNKSSFFCEVSKDIVELLMGLFKMENLSLIDENNSLLLLTQPLFEQGVCSDKNLILNLYNDILNEYGNGKQIIIKPHPLEETDYKEFFKNAIIIDKNFPSELLNYMDFRVEKIITIYSTALCTLNCAQEKIMLGYDWFQSQLERRS